MTIQDEGGWTLLDRNHVLKRTVWGRHDGENTVYRIDYDVEEMINQNTDERNNAPSGWKESWHKIASVPNNIGQSVGLDTAILSKDRKFLAKWFNDSDNAAWRTKHGRI